MESQSGYFQIRGIKLEYQWHGPQVATAPVLLFLHQGLGCVASWGEFPQQLARKVGCRALVYSRAGYGNSDPVKLPRPLDYLHQEAELLPEILNYFAIKQSILVGHSDGASIALIYAGGTQRQGLKGLILEAPHVFVEVVGLEGITKIRQLYETSNFADRLRRYHGANTDCAFRGWSNVWLSQEFKAWNIEGFLPGIDVPMLVIQGEDDEYGSWQQVDKIEAQVSGLFEAAVIAECGHSPHKEQSELILNKMTFFIKLSCS